MENGILNQFRLQRNESPHYPGHCYRIRHEKMDYTQYFRPDYEWDGYLVWAKPADLYVQSGLVPGFFVASEATLLFLPEQRNLRNDVTVEMPFEDIVGITREKPRLKAFDYVAGGALGVASGAFSVVTVPGYFLARKLENVVEIRLSNGEVTQYDPGGGVWDERDKPKDLVRELQDCKQHSAAVRRDAMRQESVRKLQQRLATQNQGAIAPGSST